MFRFQTRVLLVLILAFFAGGAAVAGASDATVARLGNGLDVVLIEIHGSPMIASTMIVGAGADWETASTAGSSHMLEHLLFNGTERRTQKELYDETDFYGIYNNATTRRSHTVYFVLAQAEYIRQALDIQEDMLFHSTLPADKFEKERGIVVEEIGKDEQNPSLIADRLFRAKAFRASPYGREVLGTRETIEALSRDDVLAYYHATYAPNNMTLLLTGDFDTGEMLGMVREIFGGDGGRPFARGAVADPPPLPEPPETVLHHAAVDKGYLSIAFDAPPLAAPETHLFSIVAELLGDRLNEELALADDPLLLSVGCFYERRDSFGRLVVSCEFDPSRDADDVEKRIVREIERFREEGVDADHLARFVVSRKTADIYLSEKLHYYGMMKAAEYALAGRQGIEAARALLDTVTAARINRAAGELLRTAARLSVGLAPGEKDYGAADFAVTVPGEKNPWEAAAGAAFEPGEFEIIRRAATAGTSAGPAGRSAKIDTTLPGGLRVMVDSNDDSEVFAVHLLMRDRSWREPQGKAGIADFVHRLLPRGTTRRSGAELRAALGRIGAELKVCDASFIPYDDYYTTPEYSFIRFTTIDEYALEGIALLAEMVTSPALSDADVEAVRAEKLAAVRGNGETPANLSLALLRKQLYRGHPLRLPPEGTEESIEAITAEDVRRFHPSYFRASEIVVSVVTSLPADEVVRQLGKRFAGLPVADGPITAPGDPAPTTLDTTIAVERGVTQAYIRTGYVVSVPEEDRAALQVAVSLLSGDLSFDLRETEGLAYSIGAGGAFRGETATIGAAMGTGPENLDEALSGIRGYLDRELTPDDVGDEDVARTVNALIGRNAMRRLSRPSQAYRLGLRAFLGDTVDAGAALRAVSTGDVIRVHHRYIRSAPAITVIVK